MAQSLLRKTLKVFGLGGTTDDFEEFGSTAIAATVYTKDIPTIQSLAAWNTGWRAALVASKAPVLQDMNGVMYVHSYLEGYLFQEGIPEYDAGTTYNVGSVVKVPYTGSYVGVEIYVSLIDANLGNALPTVPASDGNWQYGGNIAQLGNLPIIPYAQKIEIGWISNTTQHLLYDQCVLEDSTGGKFRKSTNGLELMNIATNGVDGLDTGSVAASTFYYVFLISNGTLVKGLYSLSPTAPTMPAGYTYKLLVGAILTDVSSHIVQTLQVGQYVQFAENQIVVSDTTHHDTVQVGDVSSVVPPNYAWAVELIMSVRATYAAATGADFILMYLGFDTGGSGLNPPQIAELIASPEQNGNSINLMVPCRTNIINEAGPITFKWSNSINSSGLSSFSTSISVRGFYLTRLSIF